MATGENHHTGRHQIRVGAGAKQVAETMSSACNDYHQPVAGTGLPVSKTEARNSAAWFRYAVF
jgi:hypothetical protein